MGWVLGRRCETEVASDVESPEAGVPRISLPERVDRRARLGPFPSARDALKFVCYAAVGAVVSPFASPFAWVPFLAVGFVVSVWRPDDEAVDERAGRWVRFVVDRWRGASVTDPARATAARGAVVYLASGHRVAIVRAGGTPLAYRPPAELAVLFDRFRELLRASNGPLIIRSTTVALREGPVLPGTVACTDLEWAAREGYRELVSVLCRRRRSRRVEIALSASASGPEGERRLVERARSLAERLSSLGVRSSLLDERRLIESARAFGWAITPGES
jgi:hypothetical protein